MTSIQQQIDAIDVKLKKLESEQAKLLSKRSALLTSRKHSSQNLIFTPAQKVQLFGSLFKGRQSIYAKKWTNKKGVTGFSVACDNEWKPNICEKPRVKCGDCPNKLFTDISDRTLFDHLSGKMIVGVYPLLENNTCHFLASDFDKHGWQESVIAMANACDIYEVPCAIEVSQSGNGGHLWMFFSEAVEARDARSLGFALLDKAMELQPKLSFDSYDRLFPNQDFLPVGGFGNLIALPLQKEARNLGFSQFVDRNLRTYTDQWDFLQKIDKISPAKLNTILSGTKRSDREKSEALSESLPWEGSAKEPLTKLIEIKNLPQSICITLANHLYFNLQDVPGELTAKLKRIASFSNPVFFKQQALRFSTNGIPRFISCARIEKGPNNTQWLSLPRGCFDEVMDLLKLHTIEVTFDDKRYKGTRISKVKFLGQLKKDQTKVVNTMLKSHTGILHAPTAFGKTVAAIGIIAKRKVNTLILTHSKQLLAQWQERLKAFTEGVLVGVVGGGKNKPTKQIDVATYQSFINRKDNTVSPLITEYGQVIIDECHHISAAGFEMVLNEVKAKYVFGLTATPTRQDGLQKIMFMLAGPVRQKVQVERQNTFEQNVTVSHFLDLPPISMVNAIERPHISDVYLWVASNEQRNMKIIDDIKQAASSKRNSLVLTERREHAKLLHELLFAQGLVSVLLYGSMKAKERDEANSNLSNTQVIVATGKYIGEGFDLPKLDTLFLAMPIAWKGTLAQYAGRIHREYEGKTAVTIIDYVDINLPMLVRMYKKREKGYLAMGYNINYEKQRPTIEN